MTLYSYEAFLAIPVRGLEVEGIFWSYITDLEELEVKVEKFIAEKYEVAENVVTKLKVKEIPSIE